MHYSNWGKKGFSLLQFRVTNINYPSLAAKLNFPDCADPCIPDEVFAREIIDEFAKQIFLDYLDPWWEYGSAVLSLACADPSKQHYELDEPAWLSEFMPDRLPYDYAEPIVADYLYAWAEADRVSAPAQVRDNNYEMIMGGLLKRSRLSLQGVMDALVNQGAVEAQDGITAARSVGKMVEDLIACLKEESMWNTPAVRNRLEYKELDYNQLEKAAEHVVSGYAKWGWERMLSYQHPLEDVMDTVDNEITAIENNVYEDMLSWSDCYRDDFINPANAIYETVGDRLFSLPPISLLEASMAQFIEQLEAADPSPQVVEAQNLLKKPFDKKESYVYDYALDIDGDVWAELMSREMYKAVNDAIDKGDLPTASVDAKSLISEIEAEIAESGPNSYCWLVYRFIGGLVRITSYQPAVLGAPVNGDELIEGEHAMMVTYAEAIEWLDGQSAIMEMLLL